MNHLNVHLVHGRYAVDLKIKVHKAIHDSLEKGKIINCIKIFIIILNYIYIISFWMRSEYVKFWRKHSIVYREYRVANSVFDLSCFYKFGLKSLFISF